MNDLCTGCGKPPHAGGCRLASQHGPPSDEEVQRRRDYLASDEFKRQREASLAGRRLSADPIAEPSINDRLNAVVVQRNEARERATKAEAALAAARRECDDLRKLVKEARLWIATGIAPTAARDRFIAALAAPAAGEQTREALP